MKNTTLRGWSVILATATLTAAALVTAVPPAASTALTSSDQPLANLAHLDFLLDAAAPAEVAGHTTYRLAEEPQLTFPWTYADARPGGTFERIGGGPLDEATGHYAQGAYDADDVARAAVVYLRHWQQTGSPSSQDNAYQLLRSLAYLQTSSGPNAGNVVLWIQADGELNPSAEPVELPDPSDSGPSYWLARAIWAFGEGYAAFRDTDPEFAGFLQERLQLSVNAVDRQVLDKYGQFTEADGMSVPSWLIIDGADASAEAVLGLAAYVEAEPGDPAARATLAKLSEGIAAMGAGNRRSWPYGAILPWAQSRSMWHGWGSQMPAALAEASLALDNSALLAPAIADAAGFTPTMLTAGGPDNGWFPTPTDKVQIAYGADSRLQSLLGVAKASGQRGFEDLAVFMASWYFGTNPSGEPMYDPATGVTFDGVQPDGSINRNSGAESTIHGLLSMLALDSHPEIRVRAQALTSVTDRAGLTVVEAEQAVETDGNIAQPDSAWTGESSWSGNYLELSAGQSALFDLGSGPGARLVEPVSWLADEGRTARSLWRADRGTLGYLKHSVGGQGITAVPGELLPLPLNRAAPAHNDEISVASIGGTVKLDALIVRPEVSRLTLAGNGGAAELVHSASRTRQRVTVGQPGTAAVVRSYDASGALVAEDSINGPARITLKPGGFAVVTS